MNTLTRPPDSDPPPPPSPYFRVRVEVFRRLADQFAAAEGLPPYAA